MAGKWKLENITPEKAIAYLGTMSKNRRVKKVLVDRICDDIKTKNFHVTHQGIAFNSAGHLIDGQHRLLAVISAKSSIHAWVYRYDEEDDGTRVDCGISRDAVDRINIAGGCTSKIQVSVLKRMIAGVEQEPSYVRYASVETLREWLRKHHEAVDWAMKLFAHRPKYLCSASLIAVFARAFYTQNRELLSDIATVIQKGETTNPKLSGLIKLRDYFTITMKGAGGMLQRAESYRTATYCIHAALNGKKILLKQSDVELFEIPQ